MWIPVVQPGRDCADDEGVKIVTEGLEAQALAASGLVAWRWDAASNTTQWSSGAEDIMGLPDIVLRSPDLLIRAVHPDDAKLVYAHLRQALKTATPFKARCRVRTSSGIRWFDTSGQALLGESGELVGATGTLLDVSEECEADEAVMAALSDAECALEQIGAWVWEWDHQTDLVTYYKLPEGTHRMAESRPDVLLSQLFAVLDPEDAARARATLNGAVETGERFTLEVAVPDAHGVSRRTFVRGGVLAQSPNRVSAISIVLD